VRRGHHRLQDTLGQRHGHHHLRHTHLDRQSRRDLRMQLDTPGPGGVDHDVGLEARAVVDDHSGDAISRGGDRPDLAADVERRAVTVRCDGERSRHRRCVDRAVARAVDPAHEGVAQAGDHLAHAVGVAPFEVGDSQATQLLGHRLDRRGLPGVTRQPGPARLAIPDVGAELVGQRRPAPHAGRPRRAPRKGGGRSGARRRRSHPRPRRRWPAARAPGPPHPHGRGGRRSTSRRCRHR
jgi:hypothetical protein